MELSPIISFEECDFAMWLEDAADWQLLFLFSLEGYRQCSGLIDQLQKRNLLAAAAGQVPQQSSARTSAFHSLLEGRRSGATRGRFRPFGGVFR
jgi:hypothetical protein